MAFYRSWGSLFLSIGLVMLLFIPWDIYFTASGYWGFNPAYLSGVTWWHLPVEEWLFFVVVPYSCVFLYRSLNYFFPAEPNRQLTVQLARLLLWFSLGIAVLNYQRWYTVSTFALLSAFLWYIVYYRPVPWLGKFLRAYAVILIPFALMNGVLTGSGLPEPVVWYNDAQNLGMRLGTIPLEDTFYGMLLIGLNIFFYEKLEWRRTQASR